jgi:adenylate cyclase
MSVAQLIGPNVLGSLLAGRYYYPREEQRIVLFLDLVGSTSIAERIGNVRFHAMLSETFTRLSRVVTDSGGEVYRYVGDAMIATWPLGTPEENGHAIRCMFACRDTLDAAASHLMDRYGHTPAFRAGVHAGALVAGEIGGFKREIALLGDTMNTAARIEQACRTTGHALLASKPLLDRTVKPADIVATSIGGHRLRGKSEYLELFALERGATDRVESHDRAARAFAEADAGDAGARASVAQAISSSSRER